MPKVVEIFTDLNMQQLAARVRYAREACGLTQTQVAFRANLNLGNYNDLERGKRPGLRVATLYGLCQVLRVSADYLLGLGEHPWLQQIETPAEAVALLPSLGAADDGLVV